MVGTNVFSSHTCKSHKYIGTLVDSTSAIVKHWHHLAEEMGVDADEILATSHGRRSIDTLKMYDESRANWQCKCQLQDLSKPVCPDRPLQISARWKAGSR